MLSPDSSRITLSDCRSFVENKVFRLQPEGYGAAHPIWPGCVGLELESQVVNKAAWQRGEWKQISLQGELVPVLRKLSQAKGWKTHSQDETPEAPLLKIELPQSDLISFEPGGQIEFSSVPYPCLEQACERMRHVFVELDEGLEQHGLKRVELGINPFASVDEIGLQMTKPRYRAMDKHFASYWPEAEG